MPWKSKPTRTGFFADASEGVLTSEFAVSFEEFIRSAGPPFCQFQKRINDDVMAVGMEGDISKIV